MLLQTSSALMRYTTASRRSAEKMNSYRKEYFLFGLSFTSPYRRAGLRPDYCVACPLSTIPNFLVFPDAEVGSSTVRMIMP